METFSVEIINKKALHILKDMEQQQLIRLKKDGNPSHKKMSFAGKLHLTDKQYQSFSNYTKNIRNEWEHRI